MIIKYITELLYDHECVIVPGFGAFITKEAPATLDYVNNMLLPPSKELAFNGQLVTDDGLLIGYVAKRQGVTTTEAAKMVHDFAMRNLAVLEASGALRLDGMGNLLIIPNICLNLCAIIQMQRYNKFFIHECAFGKKIANLDICHLNFRTFLYFCRLITRK